MDGKLTFACFKELIQATAITVTIPHCCRRMRRSKLNLVNKKILPSLLKLPKNIKRNLRHPKRFPMKSFLKDLILEILKVPTSWDKLSIKELVALATQCQWFKLCNKDFK
jgi:hypothetical protein